jgi:hypothetical protein
MKLTKSQLKQIIKEEINKLILEEGLGDWAWEKTKQVANFPGRMAKRYIADPIYDLTQNKDVPKYHVGPADKVSSMEEPWDYKEATEDWKDIYSASAGIASLLSLGLIGGAVAGKGSYQAIKAYLIDKGISAPEIALSTYAIYETVMQKAGKLPVGEAKWEAGKAALYNIALALLPAGKKGAGDAFRATGEAALSASDVE